MTHEARGLRLGVVGHGVDLVEVDRVAALLAAHPERFARRVFTAQELADVGDDVRRAMRLAARFAAKEAAMKAIGTGLSQGVSWHDFAVATHASGKPELVVSGRGAEIGAAMGVRAWLVSLSHTRTLAMASVLALA